MTVTHLVAGGVALDATGGPRPVWPRTTCRRPSTPWSSIAILASVVDPFDPMEKAFHQLGERFLAETEHLHRDWRLVQTYALSPALRAMSHVWAAPEGWRAGGRRQGRAGGGGRPVPPRRRAAGAHRRGGRRTGRRRPARAGGGARPLRGRRPGRPSEHDFDFEFVGLLGLADPLRAAGPGGDRRVPGGRHPRGDDHRRLPRHRARHRAPGRPGRARGRGAVAATRWPRSATTRCASAWPPSASAPASRPSRSCASCRR